MMNTDYRSNMLTLLQETGHLNLVNGEQAFSAVGVVLMVSTIHLSAESDQEKVTTGTFLQDLMEHFERAGYRHWHVLERMLLDGTPTKHFESGRYFQDGDEALLMMEMCGDALDTLGDKSGEIVRQLFGNLALAMH